MSCLVLGGAGPIGSSLVDALLIAGHHVTTLDDSSNGQRDNLSRWKKNDHLEFVFSELMTDESMVRRASENKDWVFFVREVQSRSISLLGSALAAASECGVKRFVCLSSMEAVSTRTDDDGVIVREHFLIREQMCDAERDLSTVSLRCDETYGPRCVDSRVNKFVEKARLSSAATTVNIYFSDLVWVGDVARAFVMAAFNKSVSGVVEIGSKFSSRANDELGWAPTVNLEDGVKFLMSYDEPGRIVIPSVV